MAAFMSCHLLYYLYSIISASSHSSLLGYLSSRERISFSCSFSKWNTFIILSFDVSVRNSLIEDILSASTATSSRFVPPSAYVVALIWGCHIYSYMVRLIIIIKQLLSITKTESSFGNYVFDVIKITLKTWKNYNNNTTKMYCY